MYITTRASYCNWIVFPVACAMTMRFVLVQRNSLYFYLSITVLLKFYPLASTKWKITEVEMYKVKWLIYKQAILLDYTIKLLYIFSQRGMRGHIFNEYADCLTSYYHLNRILVVYVHAKFTSPLLLYYQFREENTTRVH